MTLAVIHNVNVIDSKVYRGLIQFCKTLNMCMFSDHKCINILCLALGFFCKEERHGHFPHPA